MTSIPKSATVSDEAVQAALEKWFTGCAPDSDLVSSCFIEMRDTLIAALPHLALSAALCSVEVPDTCDGKEQLAFEEWAKSQHYNMQEHPLHYLFLDKRTDAARNGWRSAIKYCRDRILSKIVTKPVDGSMTPEEFQLEDLKQMASYTGKIVSFETRDPYYLASCDCCGWVGSSELCGTDSFGDDGDVYCPRCHASGADSGMVAERISAKPVDVAAVREQWASPEGTAALGESGDIQ